MFQSTGIFHAVPRPEGVTSRYSLVVVDGAGRPHLPLTRFYEMALQGLSDAAARTYLNVLLPYFTYLATDDWRHHRGDRWDSPPEAVQQSVRDYLVYQLACKVRWRETYEQVSLTARSPSSVRVFLSSLKLFYQVMRRIKCYSYPHPLTDTATRLLREVEYEEHHSDGTRRMPQISGVEDPLPQPTSENYFRLVEGDWIPQPIDDQRLHKELIDGFNKARVCLRDQIVIRMAYESGARIGEILQLTVGDWRGRGARQEALACSKGSRGRRIKVIRFSSTTAKMLLQYLNTDRASLDREHRRLDALNSDDPLFLSRRRRPYSYEAFKPHWYKLMNYFNASVAGTPWANQLAFLLAVLTCYAQLSPKTVRNTLSCLHCRFETIFRAYGLTSFPQWDPETHVSRYMHDPDLKDSLSARNLYLRYYTSATSHLLRYLHSLPTDERPLYQHWALPPLPPGMSERLQQAKEVQEVQAMRRKAESDAVTPHFARIRGEAHVRWNELHRLRQKFHEVVALVQSGNAESPVSFSYEEPRRGLRLYFTLWDRPSFVIAHFHRYHQSTVEMAHSRRERFAPERNHYFLEFNGADPLNDAATPRDPDALLWFGDLLRYGVLGTYATSGTAEEVQRKQAYLRSWGYGTEESEEDRMPFYPNHPGLLAGSHAEGTADFMAAAQQRTDSLLLQMEPLFAAATFGLACLDFFTTTGARMTELLQLSLSPDCLYTMEVGGTQRLLVRLVPKGRDKPAEYMIGPETRRNLERVVKLLKEHYNLRPGDILPHVAFHPGNNRAHEFTDPRPYLLQYSGAHLSYKAIAACMRFLMHSMVFQDAAGNVVVLKAHLLRHVFATHLHQVEQVPLDIVAKILHQKNVQVTGYYAAPQWQQIVETTDSLLDRFATHLGNVEEAFVRTPAELQRQLEDAQHKVGALAKVPGGQCTCYALCPFSFVCTGCIYKVPDPDREEEVIEQEQWAFIRLEQVKRRGMGPETVKMEALMQRCKVEREEMRLIREYRKDEAYDPPICIEVREEHQPPVVEAVPPGQARAHGATGQGHRRSAAQGGANGHA